MCHHVLSWADSGSGITTGFSVQEVKTFATYPLRAPLSLQSIVVPQKRADQGLSQLPTQMQFDLAGHPSAKAHIAQVQIRCSACVCVSVYLRVCAAISVFVY